MHAPAIEAPDPAAPAEATPHIPYTPDEQKILDDLAAVQERLQLSDERFARDYIRSYSASTWSRLRTCDYRTKDRAKVFAELRKSLANIRLRLARVARQTAGTQFHALDQFRAIMDAVTECVDKAGQNRLIAYVAPTGGGKTRVLTELSAREETSIVVANESWRNSYYFAGLDILHALGGTGKFRTAGDVRNEMLALLSRKKIVLGIDEGNYFGAKSINLIKDVLNLTSSVVLLCCTPAHFDTMKRFWPEWVQLQRRLHCVYRLQPITPEDVRIFLAEVGLNGDSKPASIVLAKAANEFGAFDFIQRVTARMQETEISGPHPTLQDVEAAICHCKAQLDLGK